MNLKIKIKKLPSFKPETDVKDESLARGTTFVRNDITDITSISTSLLQEDIMAVKLVNKFQYAIIAKETLILYRYNGRSR